MCNLFMSSSSPLESTPSHPFPPCPFQAPHAQSPRVGPNLGPSGCWSPTCHHRSRTDHTPLVHIDRPSLGMTCVRVCMNTAVREVSGASVEVCVGECRGQTSQDGAELNTRKAQHGVGSARRGRQLRAPFYRRLVMRDVPIRGCRRAAGLPLNFPGLLDGS